MTKKILTPRQKFFTYPISMTEILGPKGKNKIIKPSPSDDLVEIVENLSKNEGVIINFNIYPAKFRDQNHFFKHGNKVWLDPYETLTEAREARNPFWKQREQAFNNLEENVAYSGYGWWHLGRERFPITSSLVDSIEGAKTRTRSQISEEPTDKICINEYEGSKFEQDARTEGKIYIVRMHSRTENFWHQPFSISGASAYDDDSMFDIIRQFDSDHNCGKATNKAVHFRHRGTGRRAGKYLDHHVIAPYIKIMQDAQIAVAKVYRKYKKEMKKVGITEQLTMPYCAQMQMNPFALPTQKVVDYYLKLRTQVMVFDYDPKKRRKWHRPLHEAEIEKNLWDCVEKYKYKPTFFAVKHFRDYDWSYPKNRR